ncbi:F-box/LRR-repeat protein At3g48880 [Zea mays]|uniref:F-box/LRR-repeat protein At3g48880 n=1 Tax=Zea mays TaxID=4577 RepID=UPI000220773E|nr:F-box/LRR-repeat protein At3g48880 [Zea mays]ONM62315.1 F-box domain containing protein expressed [Zea mays]|eukprot:XP_008644652.1 F-box/LRR-repeat protein At3g48880 [Zea mays]
METAAPAPAPWAEMEMDCMVQVFVRLDLEDLAAAAPLVCRSWRRAAADPSLWRALDLRRDHVARFMPWGALAAAFARHYAVRRFSVAGFLRLCVSRARGYADDVALPPLLAEPADEIDHISLHCPRLRRLALPQLTASDEARLPDIVPRWPLLEHLELEAKPSSSSFPALAAQLALHCPGFASLKTSGAVKPEDAAALARSLPRLRSLCLDRSYLPKEQFLSILAACRDLREFSARCCVGFDDKDEEVLRRGARIQRFDVEGSKLMDDLEDEFAAGDGFCDSAYVDVM